MAQLEVLVERLNRRKSPVTNFADKSNIVDVVPSGFRFESVGYIENSLGGWYQHQDGLWSWEKALKGLQVDYNQQINVSDDWKNTKGDGITIAILDTGLSSSFKSNFNVPVGYNALTDTVDEYEDVFGHGTFVSGIIAGNGRNSIRGIAPNAKLIVIKIADQLFDSDFAAIGIKWLFEKCPFKPDIINISADFPSSTKANADFFASTFSAFNQQGIFVFGAAEDNTKLFGTSLFFPASDPNVYAVGRLDAGLLNQGQINSKVKFISGDVDYSSVNKFTYTRGSSYSTATISGTVALGLARYNLNKPSISRKEYINQGLQQFSKLSFDNTFKIFKL